MFFWLPGISVYVQHVFTQTMGPKVWNHIRNRCFPGNNLNLGGFRAANFVAVLWKFFNLFTSRANHFLHKQVGTLHVHPEVWKCLLQQNFMQALSCRVLSTTIRNFPLTYRKLWHKHQLQSFSLKWFKIGLNWIFHFATCMFFHSCCFLNAWESRWTFAHVAVCVHTLQGSSAFGQTPQRSAGASAYSTCVVCGVCAHTQQTHTREHYSQRKLGCFKHQQSACQMRERREHLPRLDENPKTWRTLRLMWKWIIQILWVASCLFIPQLPPSSSHSSPSLVLDQRWRHRPTSVWIWAVLHVVMTSLCFMMQTSRMWTMLLNVQYFLTHFTDWLEFYI